MKHRELIGYTILAIVYPSALLISLFLSLLIRSKVEDFFLLPRYIYVLIYGIGFIASYGVGFFMHKREQNGQVH
jgi:hypothetical protein